MCASITFGLIPFAYLAGHQGPKVHIKVTTKMQQETTSVLAGHQGPKVHIKVTIKMQQETTSVLIWRPTLIPAHRS